MRVHSVLTDEQIVGRLAAQGRPQRPTAPYRVALPAGLVERATDHLRINGRQGLEQLVLWGGYPTPDGVVLASLLLPETEATWGWVHVLPHEQPAIADWLREHGQLLFVEAHTHGNGPRVTEMSAEDRRHPASRQNGFMTLIVPGYAAAGIDLAAAGVWECRDLVWVKLASGQVRERLRVLPDAEVVDALA